MLKQDSITSELRVSLKHASEAGYELSEVNPEGYKVALEMLDALKDEKDPIKVADIATALKVIFDFSSITKWRPLWKKVYNDLDYLRYCGGYIKGEICEDAKVVEKISYFGECFGETEDKHEVWVYGGEVSLCPLGTKAASLDDA